MVYLPYSFFSSYSFIILFFKKKIIPVQTGGITCHLLDIRFCLYIFLFIAACLCWFLFSMWSILIHTFSFVHKYQLASCFAYLRKIFCSILVWSDMKTMQFWIFSKEQEASFRIPSSASQDLSKCLRPSVLVEMSPSLNNNYKVSLSQPS